MNKNFELRKRIKKVLDNEKGENREKIEMPMSRMSKVSFGKSSRSEVGLRVGDIRTLLREDLKKTLEKLSVNHLTRDISHLQDRKVNSVIALPILPTDIEALKKLQECDYTSPLSAVHCKRENCLSEACMHKKKLSEFEVSESIDKILIGNPTGRQDIKELCGWFQSMLANHQNASVDTIMLIYDQCAKELTRQVAVNCLERGELLQVLFKYQNEVYKKKIEENEKIKETLKNEHLAEIRKIKENMKKRQKEFEGKVLGLQKRIDNAKVDKEKVVEELNKWKKWHSESAKKYMEEERIWKNKHFRLLMKLKECNVTYKVGEHELSVVNWVKKEDNTEITDAITNKNLNQELLDYEANFLTNLEINEEISIYSQENQFRTEESEAYNGQRDEDIEKSSERFGSIEDSDEKHFAEIDTSREQVLSAVEYSAELPEKSQNKPEKTFKILKTEEISKDIQETDPIPKHSLDKTSPNPQEIEKDTKEIASETDPTLLVTSETLTFTFIPLPKSQNLHLTLETLLEIYPLKPENPIPSLPSLKPQKTKKRLLKLQNLNSHDLLGKTKEMKQIIESLKAQLELKTQQVSDSSRLKFGAADNMKINIVKSSLAKSTGVLSPKMQSPRGVFAQISPPGYKSREVYSRDDFLNSDVCCEFEESNNDPYNTENEFDESLIPLGCDLYSWKTGFSSGLEKGRMSGIHIGELLGIEEKNFEAALQDKGVYVNYEKTPENRSKFNRGKTLKAAKIKEKNSTKFLQFQFNRPSGLKKLHPVYGFITKAMLDSGLAPGRIALSRKIINKMISSVLLNCLSRLRCGDTVESLVEQVYDDFYQKYGLKLVCESRFTEFLSSLFLHTNSRRVSVFIHLLGFDSKTSPKKHSKKNFPLYLSALSYMMNSKIGVVVAFDEIGDKQMFPTQRGVECLKEKLEPFAETKEIVQAIEVLQNHSETDNKGINPSGLVELELVLELILNLYEDFQTKVEKGVLFLFEVFGSSEGIGCYELIMIVRHINSERFEFTETETLKKLNFSSFCKEMLSKEFYTVSELTYKCLEHNLLSITDIHKFSPSDPEATNDFLLANTQSTQLYQNFLDSHIKLPKLSESFQTLLKTLNHHLPHANQVAFSIFTCEFQRLLLNP